jgi:predicted site-specific integrase-resolvase
MGAASRLFQEERERHLIEVPDSFYREHFELLKYPRTRHIRTIVTADENTFKDDKVHQKLLKDYTEANKRLRNYEFDKRHKQKK